jgi:hypothetical protein
MSDPCPLCGSVATAAGWGGEPAASCGSRDCPMYDARLPVSAWTHLSRAVALLAACERLEREWLRSSTCNTLEAAFDGVGITVDLWEYIGARMGRGSASGPTLADALVALEARDAT